MAALTTLRNLAWMAVGVLVTALITERVITTAADELRPPTVSTETPPPPGGRPTSAPRCPAT